MLLSNQIVYIQKSGIEGSRKPYNIWKVKYHQFRFCPPAKELRMEGAFCTFMEALKFMRMSGYSIHSRNEELTRTYKSMS